MAEFAREMEEFKAANRTLGGNHQMKVDNNNNNERRCCCSPPPPPPPPPSSLSNQLPLAYRIIATSATTTATLPKPPPQPAYNLSVNKYKNYNYNPKVTWSSGNSEMKMKRRVLKYKSYAVEAQLKSSFMDSFRWMKTKYCQIIRGY